MTTVSDILTYLETLAPLDLAMDWDNPGLQLGDRSSSVTKVLVALDPFEDAAREAVSFGAELIVTHHPLFFSPIKSLTEATTEPQETYAQGGRDYKAFYEKNPNPDFVGWLRIEGTVLDYPVMQTSTDNANYYLYRDYNKNNSTQGTIYAREECDIYKPSDNVTLYGHTMKDGSMFYCLHNYTSKTTWDNNSLVFFDTFDPKTGKVEYHTYKIFSVFKTSANVGEGFSYHKFEDAANEQEFNDFVSNCKKLAFYDTGVTPKYGDKLLCLSTCEYTLDNGRLVVAAVRIS